MSLYDRWLSDTEKKKFLFGRAPISQNRPKQSISYQTCSFTFFPSTSMVFTLKSMPGRGERDREEEKQERDKLNTSHIDSKHKHTCIYRSVCPGRRFIPTDLWWNVSEYTFLNMRSRVFSVPAAVWSHSAFTSLHVLTWAALEGPEKIKSENNSDRTHT